MPGQEKAMSTSTPGPRLALLDYPVQHRRILRRLAAKPYATPRPVPERLASPYLGGTAGRLEDYAARAEGGYQIFSVHDLRVEDLHPRLKRQVLRLRNGDDVLGDVLPEPVEDGWTVEGELAVWRSCVKPRLWAEPLRRAA